MNELLNSFVQQAIEVNNIQPYVAKPWLFNGFLLLSLILLLLLIISLQAGRVRFFEAFYPFLISENYALNFYKIKLKINQTDLILGLFCILQLSFLILRYIPSIPFIPKSQWHQLAGLFTMILSFFSIKYFIYSSLSHLLPSRVDVAYFGFNYAYWCFYFSLFLFAFNLLLQVKLFTFPAIFFIIVGLIFYLFLVARIVSISLRYNILGSIYIFLYFCTLEIAPIIILLSNTGVF